MRTTRRSLLALGGGATMSLAAAVGPGAPPVLAQAWPEKPVTVVVPFPPGGGTDAFARPLAAALTARSDGPSSSTTAAAPVARSAPPRPRAPSGWLHVLPRRGAPCDRAGRLPQAHLRHREGLPASCRGRGRAAGHRGQPGAGQGDDAAGTHRFRAAGNPGTLTYGSAGNGTSHHLAGELFKIVAEVDIEHVPYKGAGPALQDLIGGQIDMVFDGLGSSAGHIKCGAHPTVGGRRQGPRRHPARRANRRRGRSRRLRGRDLVCALGRGRNSQGHRGPHGRRGRRGAPLRAGQDDLGCPRGQSRAT